MRIRRAARGACCMGLVLWAALAAGAETRRVESVGAAPLDGEASDPPAREAALEAAVRNAVLRVARELLPGGSALPGADGPGGEEAWLAERLGNPLAYASQYTILEDRGERPAMFSDAGVEREYVVLAVVTVDLGPVADRLAALGVLAPDGARTDLVLVIEGLAAYEPLAMLQRLLERDRGVRSVVPVEFTPGRAVLALAADRGAREIVSDLQRDAPAGLQIVPVQLASREATLLLSWSAEPELGSDGEEPAGD